MSLDETSVTRTSSRAAREELVEALDVEALRQGNLFQEMVEAAASVCNAPVALVALVGHSHVQLLSAVGTQARELPLDQMLVEHVVSEGHSLLIEDVSSDARFKDAKIEVQGRQVCFYFGHPLMIDNTIPIGSLTVIDFAPRRLSAHHRAVLTSIARQVELQLEFIVRQKGTIEASGLAAEIAVGHHVNTRRQVLTSYLLHDVINAATAVKADAEYVRGRMSGDADVEEALDDISVSVDAMAELLHSAREILLDPEAALTEFSRDINLERVIEDVIELHEFQFARSGRQVRRTGTLSDPYIAGDRKLLREMIESLVGATLAATPAGSDIEIQLEELDSGTLELVYCDAGDAASDKIHNQVSKPALDMHERRELDAAGARDSMQALSLCSMIVEAHGGTMRIENLKPGGRCFRIFLPR